MIRSLLASGELDMKDFLRGLSVAENSSKFVREMMGKRGDRNILDYLEDEATFAEREKFLTTVFSGAGERKHYLPRWEELVARFEEPHAKGHGTGDLLTLLELSDQMEDIVHDICKVGLRGENKGYITPGMQNVRIVGLEGKKVYPYTMMYGTNDVDPHEIRRLIERTRQEQLNWTGADRSQPSGIVRGDLRNRPRSNYGIHLDPKWDLQNQNLLEMAMEMLREQFRRSSRG